MEWREFCDRMAALGQGIDDPEGVRHLANQVACWLTYAIGHNDPLHPTFFRSSDPVYQWGGPNADQVARRARIEGHGSYRISGRMGSCEEFILQVKLGTTQSGGAGIALEVTASSLGLAPGDDIDIILSGAEHPGTTLGLHVDATSIHIRDYYFDWQPTEPATFVIERLDVRGSPKPPADAATMLDEAAAEIEHSMRFWTGYQDRMLAGQPPNAFGAPAPAGGGVQDCLFSHCAVALGAGEALVVELDDGGAPMWDIQLYNRPWYEALDFTNRLTSSNHKLAAPGPFVIAGADPGGANWLDTEGRTDVLCTIRWWQPRSGPAVSAAVVPLAALDLPPMDRAAQLARRASHVAWRYRT